MTINTKYSLGDLIMSTETMNGFKAHEINTVTSINVFVSNDEKTEYYCTDKGHGFNEDLLVWNYIVTVNEMKH